MDFARSLGRVDMVGQAYAPATQEPSIR